MRISDYVRKFENWFNDRLDQLFADTEDLTEQPPTSVKIVVLLQDGKLSHCFSNHCPVEMTVLAFSSQHKDMISEEEVKDAIQPCPFPIVPKIVDAIDIAYQ